jgi:3-oxoacyl-[acyl-carrier protein] reductase
LKALITGASGALGRAVARRLSEDGFEVWIHYGTKQAAAASLLDDITSSGGSGRLVGFDVRDSASVDEHLLPLLSREGPLDVLVNNAGIPSEGYMMMMPEETWRDVLDVNLTGVFLVTRACLKGMVQQRAGRVVNISSLAGAQGAVGQSAYAATKAGLEGVTRVLALEMARWNILVNAVAAGPLEEGMASPEQHEKYVSAIPLGRLGGVDEVAGAVSFLCSKDASYITGQVIPVNGGMGM